MNMRIKSLMDNKVAAEFHRMAKLGVCILDPTRTMSLIPKILLG